MERDLSDNQRRTICRLVFLFVCALPTIVTLYFVTHQRTADQWARLLQAELGVRTYIGNVETPLPGEVLFRNIKLYNKDENEIFESIEARVTLGNVNRIHFRSPVQLTQEGLGDFLEEAADRLVRPQTDIKPWEIYFDDIEVFANRNVDMKTPSFHMSPLYVSWSSGLDGRTLSLAAPLPRRHGDQSVRQGSLTIAKNRESNGFVVSVDTTMEASVPCWMVRQLYPQIELKLGEKAEFSGHAEFAISGAKADCELTGKFMNINIPQLASANGWVAQNAQSILVNGLKLTDSNWTQGNAAIVLDDNRTLELRKPGFVSPEPAINKDLFTKVLEATFRDEFNTTLFR